MASRKHHVAVIGAGAFGGWTALHLLRGGARVTLLDAWGPGNSRSSSGGESRVIRATYGPDRIYTRMAVRALQLWKESQARWNRQLYRQRGVLWLVGRDDRYEKAALPHLREAGLDFEEMLGREAAQRFPQINFAGVAWVILEKDAGYLTARRACETVLNGFLQEGGAYQQLGAKPGLIAGGEMRSLLLSNRSRLAADHYVFACGPWLGKLFPGVIGNRIQPTRQEVFFFGTPPGDLRFSESQMPVWIDAGPPFRYGIPGSDWRGFKFADDTRGAPFDPTSEDRTPSRKGIRAAREYLHFRFPGMRKAPLVDARVCQYEETPDRHFILDRHPVAENVWLVGGGSGHGFKHGPAVGERAAALVLGESPVDPCFALSRFGRR